jgi:hypothetical protein
MVKVHANPITESDRTRRVIEHVIKRAVDRCDLGDNAYRARGH